MMARAGKEGWSGDPAPWILLRRAALAAAGMVTLFVLIPESVAVFNMLRDARESRRAIAVAGTLNESIAALRTTEDRLVSRLDSLLGLSPEQSYSFILSAFRAAALDAKVSLVEVEPEEPRTEGPYTLIPLRVTATGRFPGLVGLVDAIERADQIFLVRESDYSLDESGVVTVALTADVVVDSGRRTGRVNPD